MDKDIKEAVMPVGRKTAGNPNWHKGMPSVNPGGRPLVERETRTKIQQFACEKSIEAIEYLYSVMIDSEISVRYRLFAANNIMDRAIGKVKEVKEEERSMTIEQLLALMPLVAQSKHKYTHPSDESDAGSE